MYEKLVVCIHYLYKYNKYSTHIYPSMKME